MSEAREKAWEELIKTGVSIETRREAFLAGWEARKKASFKNIYGGDLTPLQYEVLEWFERNKDEFEFTNSLSIMTEFVEVLLKREQEMFPRDIRPGYEDFRRTIDFYFRNSANDLKDKALDAFWVLLLYWASDGTSDR